VAVTVTGAAALWVAAGVGSGGVRHPRVEVGIHKIRHVVVIMQENRSFDSYFGTYPGADGIPMKAGVPAVCVPDPARAAASGPTTTGAM
jgi:phospholipase C